MENIYLAPTCRLINSRKTTTKVFVIAFNNNLFQLDSNMYNIFNKLIHKARSEKHEQCLITFKVALYKIVSIIYIILHFSLALKLKTLILLFFGGGSGIRSRRSCSNTSFTLTLSLADVSTYRS